MKKIICMLCLLVSVPLQAREINAKAGEEQIVSCSNAPTVYVAKEDEIQAVTAPSYYEVSYAPNLAILSPKSHSETSDQEISLTLKSGKKVFFAETECKSTITVYNY